jgi:hypothetical protein
LLVAALAVTGFPLNSFSWANYVNRSTLPIAGATRLLTEPDPD